MGLCLEQACIYSDLFPGWHVASEIVKSQVLINFENSSTDCEKTATGSGNLQPEIESNEYSSTHGSRSRNAGVVET